MAEIPPVLVRIQADVDQLKAGLREAEASLKNFDGDVRNAGSTVGGFGDTVKRLGATLAVTFSAGAILSFFKSSVQGAMEAEAAMSRLRQLLLTTGGATEIQIKALEAQAEALAKVGSASKESILVTQSQLATFDLQGKTIETLTPAILDYVAAEKGASATTADYKSMTNGLAQALAGNFQSLTRVGFVLDAQTKKTIKSGTESQRAAALVQVLNSTYEGFNKTLSETPAGRMAKLGKEFDNFKQTIGQALLPIIQELMGFISDQVIPLFKRVADFVKNLSDNLVGAGGLGEAFKAVATQVKNFLKPILDMSKAIAGPGSLGDKIKEVGNFLKSFFMPILTAYRDAMYKVRDAVVAQKDRILELKTKFQEIWAWISKYIVPLFQTVLVGAIKAAGTIITKVIESIGPILSTVLSGVKLLINGIIFVINKMITAYNFMADSLGKKKIGYIEEIGKLETAAVRTTTALDKLEQKGRKVASTPVDIFDRERGDLWTGSKDPTPPPTKEEIARQKKIETLKKRAKEIVGNMKDTIKEASDSAADALSRRNERLADAQERYYETVKDANKRYTETVADAEERAAETRSDALERQRRADIEARARLAKQQIEITKDYTEKIAEIEENFQARQTEIRQSGEKRRLELTQAAAARQAGIIQQSIDRLRSAFASKTTFSIVDAFKLDSTEMKRTESGLLRYVRKIKGDVGDLISDLKTKLSAAKELQANAAALAGLGYSQIFVEEIVKAGPEAGNKMAAALRAATPETTKEIQALYQEMEALSTSGLDDLATKMNAGGKLATSELVSAYAEVAEDLKKSLAEVKVEVDASLVETQKAYDKAMAQAKRDRDERNLEALAQLEESIKDSKTALDDALAEMEKTLAKSKEKAKKTLTETLAEAQITFQKALIDAQKDYEKSIDDINESTKKKLAQLKKDLGEVADTMRSIQATKEAAAALASGSAVSGGIVKKSSAPVILLNQNDASTGTKQQVSVTVNGVNMTNPQATAQQVVSGIKYGQAVLVGGTVVTPQAMSNDDYLRSIGMK